ncbi:uncharacterized protein LOC129582598 [Paramacrobiotus metropolitanus]|uniref:uncharacterized protein LOC129582598 n=1 Tax=Paramacrobiotus metropolitanus TaxID=2943436 RepID=UPI0024461F60|nr:uncharacterized protein LOC129582598 [Paramacrobiotus metropolitanus]
MTFPSMPPYKRMLADTHQLSERNTVAVRNDDGAYWLGHIQDIAGDYAFVDFQSKRVPASWLHTGRVWPLPVPEYNEHATPVYLAALRDEDDGPFRFRPITVFFIGPIWGILVKDYDQTDISSKSQNEHTELVDVGQIIDQAALSQPPMLYRTTGFLLTKRFVPFARAHDVLCDASDKSRIIHHMCESFSHAARERRSFDYGRFHLRIEQNGCTFIVSHITHHQAEAPTVETLSGILQRHLDSRTHLPAFIYNDLCDRVSAPDVGRAEPPSDDASLDHLSISLLCEIFAYLDLHSRMKLKRVCTMWISLLNSRHVVEHISICLKTCSHDTISHNLNSYKAASLLHRMVNSATKSLTILQNFDYHFCLSNLLKGMGIKVPTIIFKDHIVTNKNGSNIGYPDICEGQFPLNYALGARCAIFDDCCQRVVIYNWKVSDIFGAVAYELFSKYYSYRKSVREFMRLPRIETSSMMACLTHESHVGVLAADALQITIPQLILHSSDGRYHMLRRFMWGLNDNFPPVTEDIYTKVTAVHARWVRNLQYPAEWSRIRAYLELFSGFHADGSAKFWDELDLRTENVRTWSRMALFGIKDIFPAAECW